ncbi:ribose 5-phosphate isomerase B [Lachnospiraceae bacterium NK3A20]|jgi:ribose 5-phosphate isomerase B|nr:ribose 5-phosphate isomerase B [Lachnospiraceae bacterium NK3A20]
MTVALGCDHGGYDLKEAVKASLEAKGIACQDFGTFNKESCDYPVFARKAAEAVANGTCDKGIVICTTGIGVSIAANKVKGIRCALCHDVTTARLCREHNDANVLAIGEGVVGRIAAMDIVDTFLITPFSEGVRHARRIAEIEAE